MSESKWNERFDIRKHISLKLKNNEHIPIAEWQMLHLANLKDEVQN